MALVTASEEQNRVLKEKVDPAEEVGPVEEVVETFMETLVDPLLPSTFQVDIPQPCQEDQISVARQMHAVVLLYNFYHRKQRSEHKFLDFSAFCKLIQSLRRHLVPYMQLINESDLMDWEAAEEGLSVTEKAIRDACDIAMALYTSKDAPSTEEYPISKIAVLLIEPKKENCWLQFGAVTKGVWSLIEKEIDEFTCQEVLAEEKVSKKRKISSQEATADDKKFLKLMYDAVKDATGIGSSGLVVLETHVTYSLSKLKSATLLYVVRSPQSFNIRNSISLRHIVENLQLPFTKKHHNIRTTTASLNHFHMLPYLGIISSWLSRGSSEKTDKDANVSEKVAYENCEKRLNMGGSSDVHKGASKHGSVSMEFIKNCELISSTKKDGSSISPQISGNSSDNSRKGLQCRGPSEKTDKDANVSEKVAYGNFEKSLTMGSSCDVHKGASKHGSVSMEFIKSCELISSTKNDGSSISPHISGNNSDNSRKGLQCRGPSEKTDKDANVSEKVAYENCEKRLNMGGSCDVHKGASKHGSVSMEFIKSCELISSTKKDGSSISPQISGNNSDNSRKGLQCRGPSEKTDKDANVSEKVAYENCEKSLNMGGSCEGQKGASKLGSVSMEFIRSCELINSTKKGESSITPQISGNNSGNSVKSLQFTRTSEKTGKDVTVSEISNNLFTKDFGKGCELAYPAENKRSMINSPISGNNGYNSGDCLEGPSAKDLNLSEKTTKVCEVADPATQNESRVYSETSHSMKNSLHDPSSVLSKVNISCTPETCQKAESTIERRKSKLRDFDCSRKSTLPRLDAHGPENGDNLKVAGSRFESLPDIEAQNVLASEDSENALALLNRKRQDLCSKICSMEDRIATYEYHIERIRDGGDVRLARQYVECILHGNNPLCDMHETQFAGKVHQPGERCQNQNPATDKQKGSSSIFLPGRSSCQDLEYMCVKNNWRMPRYSVEASSDGKFMSNVTVGSKDFSFLCKGGLECSPCGARESAASEMIARLVKTFT